MNSTIKYSPVPDLNDPFELGTSIGDFTIESIIDGIKNDDLFRFKSIKKLIEKGYVKDLTEFNRRTVIQDFSLFETILHLANEAKDEVFYGVLNSVKEFVGVCSMSKNSLSIPMWSYYANNNEGAVIGYEFPRSTWKNLLQEVTYCDDRPTVDPLSLYQKDSYEPVKQTISLKSNYWKEEEEVRLVDNLKRMKRDKETKLYLEVIPTVIIKEVILGCRFNGEYAPLIKKILKAESHNHIELKQIVLNKHKFEFQSKFI